MEKDGAGNLAHQYTYGNERITSEGYSKLSGLYLYDGRGSVSDILGTFNEHRTSYEYTSLADVSVQYSKYGYTAQHKSFYGYNAESYSEKTGNIYLRNRFLNTKRQQFLSEDTYIGNVYDPLSLNRYNYAKSNPLKYKDPSGNFSQFQMQQTVNAYGFKIIHNRFNGIFNSVVSSAKSFGLWWDDIIEAEATTGVGGNAKLDIPGVGGIEIENNLFGEKVNDNFETEYIGKSATAKVTPLGLEDLTLGLEVDENGKITIVYPFNDFSSMRLDDNLKVRILGAGLTEPNSMTYGKFDVSLNINKFLQGIMDEDYRKELIERARVEGGYVRCDLFD